jgi:hypothetical protein
MATPIQIETRKLFFMVMLLFMQLSAHGEASRNLYIIERDTLQTRNFIPIINHEIYLVNRGGVPLEFSLISPVPKGKYIKGDFYPAFLEDSLLMDPVFSPEELSPLITGYLAIPETYIKGDDASFIWKKVNLPEGEALIAQYDNYFDEPSAYFTNEGLEVVGLAVHTTYSLEEQGTGHNYLFKYEIQNKNKVPVEEFLFETFVPVIVHMDQREATLISLTELAGSPEIAPGKVTRADGYGRAATGVSADIWAPKLAPGEKKIFFIRLSGFTPSGLKDSIWPVIILRGRLCVKPIWPQTIINGVSADNIERFYYVSYNLVMRDSKMISVSDGRMKVIPSK